MESFLIDGTHNTPTIKFNYAKAELEISGDSIPEDSFGFYEPVFDWLKEFEKNPLKKLQLKINLQYFNTSSSKCLLDIFKKLEDMHMHKISNIVIHWYTLEDDEDMYEIGKEFQSMLKIPFKLVETKEDK